MKTPRRPSPDPDSTTPATSEAAVQQAPAATAGFSSPSRQFTGPRAHPALFNPRPDNVPVKRETNDHPDGIALPNRLQTLAAGDRPQERLQRHGAGALSDSELLAMLLRSGTQGHDVLTLSNRLIAEAGSLSGLINWNETDFKKLKGIGRIKALQLITVMEVARRVLSQSDNALPPIMESAEAVVEFIRPLAHGLLVEKFWVLCLNRKNRLIKCVEVTSGIASATLAHPREVFRDAIKESSCAILCVHNHPSGDPSPSSADIRLTRQLREAGETIDIMLLDHVIIGQPALDPTGVGHYSFRAAGII